MKRKGRDRNVLNAQPAISDDVLGVVCGGDFRHVDCFESEEACAAAIDDEDNNTVVMKDDTWAADVGLCVECGLAATEG